MNKTNDNKIFKNIERIENKILNIELKIKTILEQSNEITKFFELQKKLFISKEE